MGILEMWDRATSSLFSFIMSLLLRMLDDGAKVRKTLQQFIGVLEDMADSTVTEIDNLIAKILGAAIADDEIWDLFWAAISDAINPTGATAPIVEPIVIDAETGETCDNSLIIAAANKLGDKTGISPITIMALIMQIIEWIKEWRNR